MLEYDEWLRKPCILRLSYDFKLNNKTKPRLRTSFLVDVLLEKDWKTFYDENQYDFKLYSLSKYIADVDREYHLNFLN